MNITQLKKWYRLKKPEINERLLEFKSPKSDKEIFEELCFCIMTANASAKMGLKSIAAIKNKILTASETEIKNYLKGNHRFYNARARYIVHTRKYLKKICGLKMKKLLDSFKSPTELRDFFAETKDIKGIGYKEASHFLRNIGYSGFAILDKHILDCLRELKVITEKDRNYLEIEQKMKKFSKKINIGMNELDLAIWSYKTGEILK
ncbi:MAG: N-glycosylase [Elusimicrobia bacterium CG06_land_8_20_14_3_00_38_11]|nr:MAG: N-glycosylase [Elusimicrobia bacterium CG06_land_8_20_14_3_00_38_11]